MDSLFSTRAPATPPDPGVELPLRQDADQPLPGIAICGNILTMRKPPPSEGVATASPRLRKKARSSVSRSQREIPLANLGATPGPPNGFGTPAAPNRLAESTTDRAPRGTPRRTPIRHTRSLRPANLPYRHHRPNRPPNGPRNRFTVSPVRALDRPLARRPTRLLSPGATETSRSIQTRAAKRLMPPRRDRASELRAPDCNPWELGGIVATAPGAVNRRGFGSRPGAPSSNLRVLSCEM